MKRIFLKSKSYFFLGLCSVLCFLMQCNPQQNIPPTNRSDPITLLTNTFTLNAITTAPAATTSNGSSSSTTVDDSSTSSTPPLVYDINGNATTCANASTSTSNSTSSQTCTTDALNDNYATQCQSAGGTVSTCGCQNYCSIQVASSTNTSTGT